MSLLRSGGCDTCWYTYGKSWMIDLQMNFKRSICCLSEYTRSLRAVQCQTVLAGNMWTTLPCDVTVSTHIYTLDYQAVYWAVTWPASYQRIGCSCAEPMQSHRLRTSHVALVWISARVTNSSKNAIQRITFNIIFKNMSIIREYAYILCMDMTSTNLIL